MPKTRRVPPVLLTKAQNSGDFCENHQQMQPYLRPILADSSDTSCATGSDNTP